MSHIRKQAFQLSGFVYEVVSLQVVDGRTRCHRDHESPSDRLARDSNRMAECKAARCNTYGERRKHYLHRHPEALDIEFRLRDLIRYPDEIYRNRYDNAMAMFYQYYDAEYWARAAIWISDSNLLRNSVFSLRFASQEELTRDRAKRFVVWRG